MNMIHDFDEEVQRRGTDAIKYACADDVLPLWVADTDFKCPRPMLDALAARLAQGHFGYPKEDPGFAKSVAGWMKRRCEWELRPEWVDFAPSAMPPLLYGILAFTAPGDQVLIQPPVYPPFFDMVAQNGRRVIANPLKMGETRYEIDFENLEQGLRDSRTRAMLLCNPHNPTGRCFSREELTEIGRLCAKYEVMVLSDEIHCDIVYPGHKHIPFGSLQEDFAAKCITTINPSKTFNTAGLRAAAFICEDPNIRGILLDQRLAAKNSGRPVLGSLALQTLYTECDYYLDQLLLYLQANLDLAMERIKVLAPKISLFRPEGTYLLWLDCRGLKLPQPELVKFFMREAKIWLNDGSFFGTEGQGFMRLNIACTRKTLREALDRLEKAVKNHAWS